MIEPFRDPNSYRSVSVAVQFTISNKSRSNQTACSVYRRRCGLCCLGLIVEGVQSCRRAPRGVDVRVDITIGCIGLCVAQDAANFRQWDMRTYEPRGRVAQIVKEHILETSSVSRL
jgi:hypothetical protein